MANAAPCLRRESKRLNTEALKPAVERSCLLGTADMVRKRFEVCQRSDIPLPKEWMAEDLREIIQRTVGTPAGDELLQSKSTYTTNRRNQLSLFFALRLIHSPVKDAECKNLLNRLRGWFRPGAQVK